MGRANISNTSDHDDVDADLPPPRARTRRGGLAEVMAWAASRTAATATPSTRAPSACCAKRSRKHQRPRRFRVGDAGPRLRRDLARRHATRKRTRYLPRVANGTALAAFALSEPEAGSDVAAHAARRARRRRRLRARRRQDVDLERRHRGLLRRVRANRRSAGRARHQRVHRRCRHAGARDRRTHRRDRAASARAPALRRRTRAAQPDARRARRRFQARDAHARYLPHVGGRRVARLRAPRDGRRARRAPHRARCSARRSATFN